MRIPGDLPPLNPLNAKDVYIYVLKYEPQIPWLSGRVWERTERSLTRKFALWAQNIKQALLTFVANPTWHHSQVISMLIEEALVEIFAVRDSNLGEKSLLDREDVSEYSGNSFELEDEVESTEGAEVPMSDIDMSGNAVANTGE